MSISHGALVICNTETRGRAWHKLGANFLQPLSSTDAWSRKSEESLCNCLRKIDLDLNYRGFFLKSLDKASQLEQ